ncbi:MAG: calcium/sodium antiporter [Lewinellaceae bacterium]|nr:calcium/sodium antiporter [Lewinellaceae bacterium]
MLLILTGLAGLWLGTKLIINSAIGIASRFNLSHSFVGVAILAVGTDLPEVFVSVKAAILQLQGIESSGIITGNAIGSSISQITFILGIAGLLLKFNMPKKDLFRDGITLISSIIVLFFFGLDGLISRIEGVILLGIYAVYYIVLMKSQTEHTDDNSEGKNYSNTQLSLFLLSGFAVLIFSSHLVVENAMLIAEKWGVAQSFIGIAIIGLGTSLPELAVTIGAAIRKSAGMSVGNVIGSNIFDGLIPIGLGGTISNIFLEKDLLYFDLPFLFASTLLVLLFLKTQRGISRIEGIVLITLFFLYITAKLFFFEGINPF